MKIPKPDEFKFGHGGFTVTRLSGPVYKYYRDALYATLVALKPKYCLEIGTHKGDSAAVFQEYFNNYMPDGLLITCDIADWDNTIEKRMPNVKFCQVYPHWYDKYIWEMSKQDKLLPDWRDQIHDSVNANVDCIYDKYNEQNIMGIDLGSNTHLFDFTFIDGDHRSISLAKDLAIANYFSDKILLDDVDEGEFYQESAGFYHGVIKKTGAYETYDFEDWGVCTNCALLTNGL